MPARSAAQQKAAGIALCARHGDTPESEAGLEDLAATTRQGKPGRKGR